MTPTPSRSRGPSSAHAARMADHQISGSTSAWPRPCRSDRVVAELRWPAAQVRPEDPGLRPQVPTSSGQDVHAVAHRSSPSRLELGAQLGPLRLRERQQRPARPPARRSPPCPWPPSRQGLRMRPQMAPLTRVTSSWNGGPAIRSSRLGHSWYRRRATSGNEFASETVPPGEPPSMAESRKLTEPASTAKPGRASDRKASMPDEALSFMPTMRGCRDQSADELGLEREPVEARRVVEQDRQRRRRPPASLK